ncbi:hypothetical protein P3S68_021662 [Capsicum galapagoense]
MVRRIMILSSLFEEIQEISSTLLFPPSSILCFAELYSVIQKANKIDFNQFHTLINEMHKELDILPLGSLNVTVDTKEKVELLYKQAKRADLFINPREIYKKEEILQLMATNYDRKIKNKGLIDFERVKQSFNGIGLRISLDYDEKIS